MSRVCALHIVRGIVKTGSYGQRLANLHSNDRIGPVELPKVIAFLFSPLPSFPIVWVGYTITSGFPDSCKVSNIAPYDSQLNLPQNNNVDPIFK